MKKSNLISTYVQFIIEKGKSESQMHSELSSSIQILIFRLPVVDFLMHHKNYCCPFEVILIVIKKLYEVIWYTILFY